MENHSSLSSEIVPEIKQQSSNIVSEITELNTFGDPTSTCYVPNQRDEEKPIPMDTSQPSIDSIHEKDEPANVISTAEQIEKIPLIPTLKLKIPKNFKPVESEESSTESDADDSLIHDDAFIQNEQSNLVHDEEKVENIEQEKSPMEIDTPIIADTQRPKEPSDGIEIANEYAQLHDLQLDEPLDKIDLILLLRNCLSKTIPYCLYCYHARRIAVNGRGLALHFIGCHRFQATVNSITAEELKPETFVTKLKANLEELDSIYLNLDTYKSVGNIVEPVQYPKQIFYECMQCRYTTGTHKELYVHNRKLHLKSKLICIMCKIPFYSFCDLICHMCPGVSNKHTILDFEFRCCLCNHDHFASAFRLMIHLRKRHFACDVCVEECHDVVKLSSHVWKHKLHHLCYRCGIAYRNKADIQKHLFWRHGTESVQCKKCLQKKWPHVYHFCTPPAVFYCEICGLAFTRAVSLRVHKRIHSGEIPYPCTEDGCEKKFISKKLLLKHVARHYPCEPEASLEAEPIVQADDLLVIQTPENIPVEEKAEEAPVEEKEIIKKKSKKRRKRDDILELISGISGPNLSESDSSDESEKDEKIPSPMSDVKTDSRMSVVDDESNVKDDLREEKDPIVDGIKDEKDETVPATDIWEKFKSFQESQGKSLDIIDETKPIPMEDNLEDENKPKVDSTDKSTAENPIKKIEEPPKPPTPKPIIEKSDEELYRELNFPLHVTQSDHDYCSMAPPKLNLFADDFENEIQASVIHDYARQLREERERQEVFMAEQRAKFFKDGDDSPSSSPKRAPSPKKRRFSSSSSSSSSSGSSSSCSCGSSCSCSSSSSDSSSDSDSEDDAKKKNKKKKEEAPEEQVVPEEPPEPIDPDTIMLETDLETDESETDEEFYDEHPQKLANQQLADKRRQLMLQTSMDPQNADGIIENSRPSTPSLPEDILKESKKVKPKKKKKERKPKPSLVPSLKINIPKRIVKKKTAPVIEDPVKLYESFTQSYVQEFVSHTPSSQTTPQPEKVVPVQNSPMPSAHQIQARQQAAVNTPVNTPLHTPTVSGCLTAAEDSAIKRSKRKRVPNKFYGYDEEAESLAARAGSSDPYQPPSFTWDKDDLPSNSKPQRPLNKRLSTAKKPKSRANSRVNSLEKTEEPLLPPVIIKTSQIVSTPKAPPRVVQPLKISLPLNPGNDPGKLFPDDSDDDESDESEGTLKISQPEPKVPKIKFSNLKKPKRTVKAKTTKPKPVAPQQPERTAPRILHAPNPTIQLEQYPSSFSQPLYPTPPATATQSSQQPIFTKPNVITTAGPIMPTPYYRDDVRYPIQTPANWRPAKEGEKVYCYCRCPYDEVSEMIGCDDKECKIEWFHFECVGILLPPNGKWYCPDCKPRHMHEFATDYPDSSGSY